MEEGPQETRRRFHSAEASCLQGHEEPEATGSWWQKEPGEQGRYRTRRARRLSRHRLLRHQAPFFQFPALGRRGTHTRPGLWALGLSRPWSEKRPQDLPPLAKLEGASGVCPNGPREHLLCGPRIFPGGHRTLTYLAQLKTWHTMVLINAEQPSKSLSSGSVHLMERS